MTNRSIFDEDIKCRNRFKDEEVFIVDASELQQDHNLEGITEII